MVLVRQSSTGCNSIVVQGEGVYRWASNKDLAYVAWAFAYTSWIGVALGYLLHHRDADQDHIKHRFPLTLKKINLDASKTLRGTDETVYEKYIPA